MNKVIIDDNFMSDKNKKYVDERILGVDYPYYIKKNSVDNENHYHMSHIGLLKDEANNVGYPLINSVETKYLLEILNDFVEKHKISCTRVLRCNVDLSFNTGSEKTATYMEHKSLLVYCTNNPEAKTVLEVKGKKFKEIPPKKYRGLYFDNYAYYNTYPKKDIKVAIVFTFK